MPRESVDGLKKNWSGRPLPRRSEHASAPAGASPPPPTLRCRLLGRAETAALRMPNWQDGFVSDLSTFLEQLLGLPQEAFTLRVRHSWHKVNVVSVQISFGSCAGPNHAELLERSLCDGSLRRLALRTCSETFWPVSQVLRQFLLRDTAFEAFWVTERHEWLIPNFPQVVRSPNAFLASLPFELGGGSNLTLLLHPNGSSKAGPDGFASLTLSSAGHERPTSAFLLTAGVNGEVWTGPFGRDETNRFLAGGALCPFEELLELVDDDQTLLLAVEAVHGDAPDPCEVNQQDISSRPAPSRRPEDPRTPWSQPQGPAAPAEASEGAPSTSACGAALLAAVEAARKCMDAVDAISAAEMQVGCEMIHAVSAAQEKVEDLSGRMSALERALRRRAQVPVQPVPEPKVAQATAWAPPAPEEPKDELRTSLEFDGTHLAWHVELSENSEPPHCLFHESLAKLSTSTADFPDEDD
ncbi:unnamed protein product [Symbiodinium natans]|uniref:Uncharacterized protein n=1 Tax=Symbiodinium natans TaxID=878477 RepID=A0A812SJV8_9DINO|nr:unnamed protein product [Symbiodinium natans]